MKRYLIIPVLTVIVVLAGFVFYTSFQARAGTSDVEEFNSVEEAKTWLQERDLDANNIGNISNAQIEQRIESIICSHRLIVPDPELAGPLGVNTQVAEVNKSFCQERSSPLFNTALMDIGSVWPGDPVDPTHQHRVWGLLAIRDTATMQLIKAYAFDITGIPSLTQAIQTQINWAAPRDGKEYRFDVEVNARLWPENIGPATYFETWFFTTQKNQIYLPIVFKTDALECPYLLHVKSANPSDTDEKYCFTATGISHAELHFNWGEVVNSWWEDPQGNKLVEFPGTDIIYRLDSPHSYRDYPIPENEMVANQWYPNGQAPWLATHHELSGQFKLNGITFRVTIPMIWDP
ncbi:hypothetical protein A2V49_00735 [candidate division WWE3 bacterium RBG_19FT_COMBO_34_6]|uniref:Uncharacterized protein n=1 Tax=candidate division WWE3 bacterium RBG_19FT_COMBO_34_6 TaxID=1802612 RepID=A0A1F4UKD2_UNCKA|nr:MAG: hypothetical protein A2V49_00735 [candidate division WWE3 bacterium RBG_19FT_COMBO_34_6]